mgnify:CR=1 FL=1
MYCQKCGTLQTNDASFCHKCGARSSDGKCVNEMIEEPQFTGVLKGSTCGALSLEYGIVPQSVDQKPRVRLYYAVPISKFVLLSILTFGLYELYWFGKNWTLIQKQEKSKISPVGRAIFSVLYMSDLASRVLKTATSDKYPESFSPTFLAIAYFALNLTWRLPGQGWLIGFASFLPIIPVVKAIKFINEHTKDGAVDSGYSIGEIMFAVVGGMILLLAIIGSLSP